MGHKTERRITSAERRMKNGEAIPITVRLYLQSYIARACGVTASCSCGQLQAAQAVARKIAADRPYEVVATGNSGGDAISHYFYELRWLQEEGRAVGTQTAPATSTSRCSPGAGAANVAQPPPAAVPAPSPASPSITDADRADLVNGLKQRTVRDIAHIVSSPLTQDEAAGLVDCCAVDIARRAVRYCQTIQDVHRLFGAPGDWGYESLLGKTLQRIYDPRRPA